LKDDVSDRIAQGAIKLYVEAHLDPIFHADFYGYRPGNLRIMLLKVAQKDAGVTAGF
jgi:retron-type reverse transcriptase